MKSFTDEDLADFADWAEKNERVAASADEKRAYGAMRQGVDWLLRIKTRERTLMKSGEMQLGPEAVK